MTPEDSKTPNSDATILQPEIAALLTERKNYLDSLTPPYTGEEKGKIDEHDRLILEASAAYIERRNQKDKQ